VAENVPGALSSDVALCLFRIVQEALNNVVKHSGALEARVTLAGTRGGMLLTIADSGRGFDEGTAIGQGGLGLASMRVRVHLVGGELTLSSHPGQGATIIAHVPITDVGQTAAGPSRVA
jgi:signal transduction histidine kinase